MKSLIGILILLVMVQLAMGRAVNVDDTTNEDLVDIEKRSENADKLTEAFGEHVAREVAEKRDLSGNEEDDLEARSLSLEDHEDDLEKGSKSLEGHEKYSLARAWFMIGR